MSDQLLKEALDALEEIHNVTTVKPPEDPGTFGQRLLRVEYLAEALLVKAGRMNPEFAKASHACHFRTGEGKVPLNMEEGELKVLEHTSAAWNAWLALGEKHPGLDAEVCKAIHDIQFRVAFRVARRTAPSVWTQETPDPKAPSAEIRATVEEMRSDSQNSVEESDPEKMMAELNGQEAPYYEFQAATVDTVKHELMLLRERWAMARNPSAREDCLERISKIFGEAAACEGITLPTGCIDTKQEGGSVSLKSSHPWVQQLLLRTI